MNFSSRSRESELMDELNVDVLLLQKIYAEINMVNNVLQGFALSLGAIKRIIKENPQSSYTILDMGCGDGAMLRKVATYFESKSFELNLIGIDLNIKSIQIAKENSKEFPNIRYLEEDILELEANDLQCDILLCTLTMHHFDSDVIPTFMNQFVKLSRLGVIINDLERSKVSYYLFQIFSNIFMKTQVAKHDGLVSIKRAFKRRELVDFADKLPNVHHDISWKWAFRYLWIIRIR